MGGQGRWACLVADVSAMLASFGATLAGQVVTEDVDSLEVAYALIIL
jgi:hypothetical protein